ncbi:MAG: glycerophosphodiester phosphodiesterase [Myxococcales bacterium]|nr:glycerophosphodiester phosphodiesterase [Myxococcales bacterium]
MAHRGACDLAPENTLESFALALRHGADLLETDLWLSADGQLVCHHDATLWRTTADPRRVGQVSAAALSRLRVRDGRGGGEREGIPRLAELLELCPEQVPVILELKDPLIAEPNPLRHLLQTLGRRAQERRAGVIGFDLRLLRRIKAAAPGLVVGHIAMRDPWGARDMDLLGPWWPLLRLNPRYVAAAHRRGQRVCPLDPHIHDPAHLRRWLALDVDALLTNDPRRTRRAVEALGGHNPDT